MQTAYLETPTVLVPFSNLHSYSRFVSRAPVQQAPRNIVYLIGPCALETAQRTEVFDQLGLAVLYFATGTEYFAHDRRDAMACVIADMHLPDITGTELQRRLSEGQHPPLIFVAKDCDIRLTISAMKAGAVEFLTEPIDQSDLTEAIRAALSQDRKLRQRKAELKTLRSRYDRLTPREREVFPLVVGGLLNKQAAALLDISEVTLQIHRSQVMRKMAAESFADLVRIAVKLRIPYWREDRPDMGPHSLR